MIGERQNGGITGLLRIPEPIRGVNVVNLFLAERQWQVQDLISRGINGEAQWIALGPSAMWALEQKGISYKLPEDYYRIPDLEDLCHNIHERVEHLCHRLDEFLFVRSPRLREWGIQPFLFNIFPLVTLFDGMVSRIFQLRAILDAHPGSKVWIHSEKNTSKSGHDLLFPHSINLWAKLLALPGWNQDINFLEPPESAGARNNYHIPTTPKGWTRSQLEAFIVRRFILRTAASHFRARGWRSLSYFLRQKPLGAILMNNGTYEWDGVLHILEDKGWRVFFTDDRFFQTNSTGETEAQTEEVHDLITKHKELADYFQQQGISFYPFFRERLAWIWNHAPAESQRIVTKMSQLVKKYSIKALLTATDASFTSHAVSQTARNLGLPVICWQHGFVSGRKIIQLNEFNDMMTSSLLFTYGEGVSAAYGAFAGKFPTEIVSVGGASFDRIRENGTTDIYSERPVIRILYVTTLYYESHWYYGFSPPFNDRIFYQEQSAIVRYLRSLVNESPSRFSATIKLHPSTEPEDPLWAAELVDSPRVQIVKQTPAFTQLLAKNDVVIIDSPTTTILQAAATSKPLFILMSFGYPEKARKMLERRAICAEGARELMIKLDRYLKTGVYEADVEDNEFLKAYGTHLDDGRNAERATARVLQAIGPSGQEMTR